MASTPPGIGGYRRPGGGFTLPELIVALSVAGVAFGAFALALVQQERVHSAVAHRVRALAQLREGLAALAADLRPVSPAAGDLPAGGARDSSLELRTTIGTAVVCAIEDGMIIPALASFVTPPGSGDTAWAYLPVDTAALWVPVPLAGVAVLPAGRRSPCALPERALFRADGSTRRSLYALRPSSLPAALPLGAPLRLTRPARYSLYRSPDSRWYLGRREWSPDRGRFETIQPVSGPYRSYAPPYDRSSGLELAYADQAGNRPAANDRIAQITIAVRAGGERPSARDRVNATTVTVGLRNAP